MLKQSIWYLVLSILVVVFARYAHWLIVWIDLIYTRVNLELVPVFSNSSLGIMTRSVLTLVVLPVVITGIPALVYRLVKGHTMPWFFETTWIVWLVIVLGKILIQ